VLMVIYTEGLQWYRSTSQHSHLLSPAADYPIRFVKGLVHPMGRKICSPTTKLTRRRTSRVPTLPSGHALLSPHLQGDAQQIAQLRRPVLPYEPILHIPKDNLDVISSAREVEYVADGRVKCEKPLRWRVN